MVCVKHTVCIKMYRENVLSKVEAVIQWRSISEQALLKGCNHDHNGHNCGHGIGAG